MTISYPILDPLSAETHARRGACALAVMIKAPRAGASKTRLVPPLTYAEAARLSAAFLCDTAANIAAVCAETADATGATQAIAVYTPVGAEAAFAGLLPPPFALLAQRGDTFGERLSNAAADLLALGHDSGCLIDSDSPTLPRAHIAAAVAELKRPGDRIVIGPAEDGGYYLLGLKCAHRRLFEEIAWSTGEVLAQTIARARELSLEVVMLPAWYDVDDADSLRRLSRELLGAPDDDACEKRPAPYAAATHTRAELKRLLEAKGHEHFLHVAPEGENAA